MKAYSLDIRQKTVDVSRKLNITTMLHYILPLPSQKTDKMTMIISDLVFINRSKAFLEKSIKNILVAYLFLTA